MPVPVWLILALCTVDVDITLGLLLISSNVKMPSLLVCCIVVYPILLVPSELRDQTTSPMTTSEYYSITRIYRSRGVAKFCLGSLI